jgi:hypothetical protein
MLYVGSLISAGMSRTSIPALSQPHTETLHKYPKISDLELLGSYLLKPFYR